MNFKPNAQILIECPNTIFQLFVRNESEVSKVEVFMNNIRTVKGLSLTDIYNWCNRQGIDYDTKFNYHKDFSFWKNLRCYLKYSQQKMKYQLGFSMG